MAKDEQPVSELKTQYTKARSEAREWHDEYEEFERIANNELLPNLDPNLPETNDGTLSASLFKLPKRVVPDTLSGSPEALDRDDEWINEFARIEWEKRIIPNANTQAPFIRKWKDAVRKASIYGGVPLVTIINSKGNYTGADFIVAYPQDVALEPGKVSDLDSDVIYWDVYYSKKQIQDIIEQEKNEKALAKEEGREAFLSWDVEALQELLDIEAEQERNSNESPKGLVDRAVKRGGIKIVMCFHRGVGSTFNGYSPAIDKIVRTYTNPDPTGDLPVHYLYCYQDMINPYGIGIVKLAGGTQNVLDYMRQADVLATQVGIRPPVVVRGDTSKTDLDSLVYAQDALWMAGNAEITRQELANGIYSQLPNRISMYKTSMNQMIPTGDTSISASAGDPNYSKTPAGVKFQQQSLSIDDEDFKDNLFITYKMVAKSMINTHFAFKQGTDIVKLSDDEKQRIFQTAPDLFPQFQEQIDPETGAVIEASNELEVIWDNARAQFDFTVNPEPEKIKDEAEKLDGNFKIIELATTVPDFEQQIAMAGKKFNKGEVLSDLISLLSDNDKILTDISPEEQQMIEEQALAEQQAVEEEQALAEQQAQTEEIYQQFMQEAMQSGLTEEEANLAFQQLQSESANG